MKIIIRDDDISYFTQPEDLERIYKDIYGKYPIRFAVIPSVCTGQRESPLNGSFDKFTYPIGKNKKLIKYINEKIKKYPVKIWQHGITHEDEGYKFEMESESRYFLTLSILEKKSYLEKIFKSSVDVFVAPHDRFSKVAMNIVSNHFKLICRGYSPLPREFKFKVKYILNYITHFTNYIVNVKKINSKDLLLRWPKIMDFGDHKEMYSYRLNELPTDEDEIKLLKKHHKNGVLCITTHYNTMSLVDIQKLKLFLGIIENY